MILRFLRRFFGGPSEKNGSFRTSISPRNFNDFEVPEVLRRSFGGPSEKTEKLQIPNFPRISNTFLGSGGSSEVLRRSFGKDRVASNSPFGAGTGQTLPG